MRCSLLLATLSIACVPDWVEINPEDDTNDTNEGLGDVQDELFDTATDGVGESSENAFEPEPNDNGNSSTESGSVETGIWELHDVSVVEDPCDWIPQIPNFFASVEEADAFNVAQLLPGSFDVDESEVGFSIKARNYGARGPVACTTDNGSFDCEPQTVDTHDHYFYGFTYYVDFTGTLVNSQHLEGRATVAFGLGENGDWWSDFLQNYDVDVSVCTQVYDLTLHPR